MKTQKEVSKYKVQDHFNVEKLFPRNRIPLYPFFNIPSAQFVTFMEMFKQILKCPDMPV